MDTDSDNETWIIDAGGAVIEKKVELGFAVLSPLERLIYCLWVADYGMRNAGDLETAGDLYPDFRREAIRLARDLCLEFTRESFSLTMEILQDQYFERFDRICDELRNA